jgi:hypothetical protein
MRPLKLDNTREVFSLIADHQFSRIYLCKLICRFFIPDILRSPQETENKNDYRLILGQSHTWLSLRIKTICFVGTSVPRGCYQASCAELKDCV